MQGLSEGLKRTPDTLEDLKFVLSVIAKIRAMSLDAELQCRQVFPSVDSVSVPTRVSASSSLFYSI